MKKLQLASIKESLMYPARTTLAAMLALCAARLLALPEVYWASISAVVVVQSDFGSSLAISWHRLVGTALGAFTGAFLAVQFGRSALVFGLGILGVGLVSVALRLGRPANRFAAIALCIVLLVARPQSAWVIALHRFLEVSVGIVAGLLLTALWPEKEAKRVN